MEKTPQLIKSLKPFDKSRRQMMWEFLSKSNMEIHCRVPYCQIISLFLTRGVGGDPSGRRCLFVGPRRGGERPAGRFHPAGGAPRVHRSGLRLREECSPLLRTSAMMSPPRSLAPPGMESHEEVTRFKAAITHLTAIKKENEK